MSRATARANWLVAAPSSDQSNREPGLPCTNTTASPARGPISVTGERTPSTVNARSPNPVAGDFPRRFALLPALFRLWPGDIACEVKRHRSLTLLETARLLLVFLWHRELLYRVGHHAAESKLVDDFLLDLPVVFGAAGFAAGFAVCADATKVSW